MSVEFIVASGLTEVMFGCLMREPVTVTSSSPSATGVAGVVVVAPGAGAGVGCAIAGTSEAAMGDNPPMTVVDSRPWWNRFSFKLVAHRGGVWIWLSADKPG